MWALIAEKGGVYAVIVILERGWGWNRAVGSQDCPTSPRSATVPPVVCRGLPVVSIVGDDERHGAGSVGAEFDGVAVLYAPTFCAS